MKFILMKKETKKDTLILLLISMTTVVIAVAFFTIGVSTKLTELKQERRKKNFNRHLKLSIKSSWCNDVLRLNIANRCK